MSEWVETTVREFCPFLYGKGLSAKQRVDGLVPVYGSNGVVGYHESAYVETPGIIIGRKGTIGAVTLSLEPFWPIDTTFYVPDVPERDLFFTFHLLRTLGLEYMNSDSAVPGLNREAAEHLAVVVPDLDEQNRIGEILAALDRKAALNRVVAEASEELSDALFRDCAAGLLEISDTNGSVPEG